jgi:hypothetical protein
MHFDRFYCVPVHLALLNRESKTEDFYFSFFNVLVGITTANAVSFAPNVDAGWIFQSLWTKWRAHKFLRYTCQGLKTVTSSVLENAVLFRKSINMSYKKYTLCKCPSFRHKILLFCKIKKNTLA